jgi:phosphatidylglycerol:prolipoprotein diacylglycerol transferase
MLNAIYHALSPIAFTIGPFAVHWYGLGYIIGLILGGLVVYRTARHWQVQVGKPHPQAGVDGKGTTPLPSTQASPSPAAPAASSGRHFDLNALLGLIIAAALGVIIGGRLGYVLFYNLPYYAAHPALVFATWDGGMSFHGGVIGTLIAMLVYARILHLPFLRLMDLVCIGAPIGICLVRCCNFINGELWGAVTNLPWGVVFGGAAGPLPRQPSQLYEAALEGLLMFCILFALSRKLPPRPAGTFCGLFALLYGVFRIAVEFVRQPDPQIGYLFGSHWITMGMVLSLPLALAGAGVLLYARHQRPASPSNLL